MSLGDIDHEALRQLAVELASEAAGEVAEHHGRITAVATKSSRTDMVTAADRAAESLITSRLRRARPDDGIVGEEGGLQAGRVGDHLVHRSPSTAPRTSCTATPATRCRWRPPAPAGPWPARSSTRCMERSSRRPAAAGPAATANSCWRAGPPNSARPSSPPVSATTRRIGTTRVPWWPASSAGCVTSAGWARPPWTSARSPAPGWTLLRVPAQALGPRGGQPHRLRSRRDHPDPPAGPTRRPRRRHRRIRRGRGAGVAAALTELLTELGARPPGGEPDGAASGP